MAAIPVFDPDHPDDDPRWKMVTCSRCGETYQCTPLSDLNTPAPELGWTGGRICDPCLMALSGVTEMHFYG